MLRVVFTGPAHSGKSTLANEVFLRLKLLGRRVEMIPEWARDDIQLNGPMRTIWEQYRYLLHQRQREDAVPAATEIMICDGGTLSGYFFATLYADHNSARDRLVIKDLFAELLDDLYGKRYDLIFVLPLIDMLDSSDGTRYQSQADLNILDMYMQLFFTKLHKLDSVISLGNEMDLRATAAISRILDELGVRDER